MAIVKCLAYALHGTYPVGTVPYSVAVGDFTGDGRPDLVVANAGSGALNTVSVLLDRCGP